MQFRELAAAAGYTAEVAEDILLDALRARFRPWAIGPLAPEDMALVAGLAARFPVDRSRLSA